MHFTVCFFLSPSLFLSTRQLFVVMISFSVNKKFFFLPMHRRRQLLYNWLIYLNISHLFFGWRAFPENSAAAWSQPEIKKCLGKKYRYGAGWTQLSKGIPKKQTTINHKCLSRQNKKRKHKNATKILCFYFWDPIKFINLHNQALFFLVPKLMKKQLTTRRSFEYVNQVITLTSLDLVHDIDTWSLREKYYFESLSKRLQFWILF